jgi:hypothetical protein
VYARRAEDRALYNRTPKLPMRFKACTTSRKTEEFVMKQGHVHRNFNVLQGPGNMVRIWHVTVEIWHE